MSELRRLLEVLKWLPPESVLVHTSTVSRSWHEASDNDELWICLSQDAFLTPYRPAGLSFKSGFQSLLSFRLPVLTSQSFAFFHCKTHVFSNAIYFSRPIQDDYNSAAVVLPGGGLLVTGGGNSSDSYYIELSGEVKTAKSMLCRREFHSIVCFRKTVYVFGGDLTEKQSAEKVVLPAWQIEKGNWTALKDSIYKHAACCPCVHSECVYLCGGNSAHSETFHIATETYSSLDFQLPEHLYGCASFHYRGELVMVTQQHVSSWKEGRALQSEENEKNYSQVWTSMKQCVSEWGVYSAQTGAIRRFDLKTRVRTEEWRFGKEVE